mmetsp:Transcript_10684/g.44388  ORF Transcript_10684/g.44388 Transcript_10684/m.44388 type:complete len:295 (+) Transcript_10684:914-1798(+)
MSPGDGDGNEWMRPELLLFQHNTYDDSNKTRFQSRRRTSQHLVPALKHVDVLADDASLDVLRASHLGLHRDRQLGEPGHQPRSPRVVPNQRFVGVAHDSCLGGRHGDGVVQTRAREALEIFAVGIGSRDHRGVRRSVRDGFGRQRFNDGNGAGGLSRREGQRASRLVTDQRLAQPDAHLAEHLAGVPRERIRRVQHKRVLRRDNLHEQRRHVQRVVRDPAGFPREKRAFVPLGRPHLLDSLVDIRRRAPVHRGGERLDEIVGHLEVVRDRRSHRVEGGAASGGVAGGVRGGDGG